MSRQKEALVRNVSKIRGPADVRRHEGGQQVGREWTRCALAQGVMEPWRVVGASFCRRGGAGYKRRWMDV